MRLVNTAGCALIAASSLALLAGCAAGSAPSPALGQIPAAPVSAQQQSMGAASAWRLPATLANRVQASKVPGGLYVAEQDAGFVPEYNLPGKKDIAPRCDDGLPLGGVNGIAVDAHRTLYVPYYDNGSFIATYAPNCGAAGPTLVDPNGQAADVAFDNKKGIVYASNANTGNVDVYDDGATSPTRILSNPDHHGNGFGVAVDRFGNVFNSGLPIVEFFHGRNRGSEALAFTGLTGPLGIEFDNQNNLLVTNEYNIAIYAPPYSGAPKQTIVTQPFCTYSALDRANKHLYVSEQTNHAVDVYTYPAGTYVYTIANPRGSVLFSGVAVDKPSKT